MTFRLVCINSNISLFNGVSSPILLWATKLSVVYMCGWTSLRLNTRSFNYSKTYLSPSAGIIYFVKERLVQAVSGTQGLESSNFLCSEEPSSDAEKRRGNLQTTYENASYKTVNWSSPLLTILSDSSPSTNASACARGVLFLLFLHLMATQCTTVLLHVISPALHFA